MVLEQCISECSSIIIKMTAWQCEGCDKNSDNKTQEFLLSLQLGFSASL